MSQRKAFCRMLNNYFEHCCYTGEIVTIVGDHDPSLMKYFDCSRSGPRSAFDSNVVYQFEMMEYVSFSSYDNPVSV